jgi:hypothetical protein
MISGQRLRGTPPGHGKIFRGTSMASLIAASGQSRGSACGGTCSTISVRADDRNHRGVLPK